MSSGSIGADLVGWMLLNGWEDGAKERNTTAVTRLGTASVYAVLSVPFVSAPSPFKTQKRHRAAQIPLIGPLIVYNVWEEDNEQGGPPEGKIVSPFKPPRPLHHFSFTARVAISRYAWLLAVETNELEGVFKLQVTKGKLDLETVIAYLKDV